MLTAPDWQGGLVAISALEPDADGRPTLVESENDIKVRHVKTRVRFRYEPPARLSWTQERGDLKSVAGSWSLEDLPRALSSGCPRDRGIAAAPVAPLTIDQRASTPQLMAGAV